MKYLPAPDQPLLGWTIVALALGCVLQAVLGVFLAMEGAYLHAVLSVVLFLPLAAGLWFRRALARQVAVILLWLIVVVVPLGIINPFAAMDELGPDQPPVLELLVFWVAPWVLPSLFALHVLGKYKREFRQGRGAAD